MRKPDILDSFDYKNQTIQVEWFDVELVEDLPDVPWQQVYAIANLDGGVPVVAYANGNLNLPGGHVEPGETIEQTLLREIEEEMNCRVIEWSMLGYQKLTSESGDIAYQARVFAKLEKIGEFTNDPGGSVIGYKLINLADLNYAIKYGKVGEHLIELVAGLED